MLLLGVLLATPATAKKGTDLRMYSDFERAVPVWAEGREAEKNLYLAFRHVLDVGKKTPRTLVRLAASTNYRLTVNGEFVAHGTCVAAHDYYRIDAYDITAHLREGQNVIGIEVAGYNVESYYLLNQPSFLQAEIIQGKRVVAATGEDEFRAYELGQRDKEAPKLSFQRSTAEAYSLKPDYDRWRKEPDWTGAEVSLARQADKQLIVRRVSYPDYRLHDARIASGAAANVYRFDCNSSGFLGMKLHVAEAARVRACFDELLAADGHVNHGRLGFDASVTYDLEPGDYLIETFEPYTMQFVEFRTERGSVEVERVYMRDYCNADVWRAGFHSGNPGLDRLFVTARETHRQNTLDVFMDCPSRERAGWLCDSYFSARVAFDMSGHTRLEHNYIENYLLPERFKDIDEGMLPMCYPSDHGNHNYIPNWAMWFVLELEEYLHRSGNRQMVDDLRKRVYALVDFFRAYLNEDGLLEKLPRWVFVEWSEANSLVQDVNYPSNMLYAEMLDVAGRLYDDETLARQAEQVRQTIRRQAFDGRFFCDNAVRRDGKLELSGKHTEVCQYYAFFLKTATPETYPELWRILMDEFGPERKTTNPYPDVPFANAFVGNYLRLEILSRAGLAAQILRETVAEYTKMAEQTGTLWEHLSTAASCNHGFASHIAHVLLRDILGIYDVAPATKTVTLRFLDSGLESCKGSIPLNKDSIDLEWQKKDGIVNYRLQLPKGYRMRIDLNSLPCKRIGR